MKGRMDHIKYNVSEALELPKDVMLDLPKIIMIGSIQLNISNHKGIIEYTQETLRINSSAGVIKVTGQDMELKTILSEEIIVIGTIEKVEIIS
ncbi:MAG: sporulation protein YqfC [Tissierellia bacterium]|nr:sporulation protein YqfC [Tissierellia bacterium]